MRFDRIGRCGQLRGEGMLGAAAIGGTGGTVGGWGANEDSGAIEDSGMKSGDGS